MARVKEYDRDKVLEKAALVFWRKGFKGTSITDLERTTGLNTFSMYREFGDKEGLFDAAMETYYHMVLMKMVDGLAREPGLAAIRSFLNAFPPIVASRDYTGCLFMNTLAEKESVNARALRRVREFCGELTGLLEKSIRQAQKKGEIDRHKDAAALSHFLLCVIQGMALYGRANRDETMIQKVLDTAFGTVGG